nr:LamG domain-containing protein [Micromonospora sp. DSM 115978]
MIDSDVRTMLSTLRQCRRRRFMLRSLLGAALVGGLLAVPVQTPAAVAADPPTVPPETPAAAASRAAAQTNERVEVVPARTELSQVFALPDGGFQMESAVVPQRTKRADGSWADINLDLVPDGAGGWRPTASTADVRFTGGGTGPMVTLTRPGGTFTLTWPSALPPPTVSDDFARYPNVRTGVDLVLRATPTGFTHVLVLNTPEAAADPTVRQMALQVGGAQMRRLPDGGLRAISPTGELLAAAPEPAMWDSTPSTAGPSSAPGDAGRVGTTSDSSPVGPGDAATIAPVATEVDAEGRLLLRPDPALLDSDTAVYPLYIDPAWDTGRRRWAYATSNNSNNTDTSVARVGANPDNGVRYRSYFEFLTTSLRSKHIRSAYVQMKLDHSWSCGDTWTHLYHTKGIATTPRNNWAIAHNSWIAAAASHAHEDTGCGTIQPDMTVNFINNAVTDLMQRAADNKANSVTVGFCACNADGEYESDVERWKKFFPADAKLVVDYSSYPGKPGSQQVSGVACPTSGRAMIGTTTPTLSAHYSDADTTQALQAAFEWLEIPPSGTYNDATPRKPAPPNVSIAANSRGTSAALGGLENDKSYAFRTRATDPAPYNLDSPWSDWCEFTVDTHGPPVAVSVISAPAGPGEPGTFRIESSDTSVTSFRYGWADPATTEVPATGTDPRFATVTLTAPKYGENILHVSAADSTGNRGYGSLQITVARPSPAVAHWGLETWPGRNVSDALADQRPELAGDTPLTSANPSWEAEARFIGASTADFGTSAMAYTASGPIVDTRSNYSVSALVRLDSTSCVGNQTAVSVDGAQNSAFFLSYSCEANRWRFRVADVDGPAVTLVNATAPTAPVAGQWTRVAGSWNATERKALLYVDGALAAQTTGSVDWQSRYGAGWQATGPLVVGRDRWTGVTGGQFAGQIADVQVFDRVLVGHDFTGLTAEEQDSGGFDEPGVVTPIEVGRWNFDEVLPCYDDALPFTCESEDESLWHRRLGLTTGTSIGDGRRGTGLALDRTHWIDDPFDPHYGITTTEYGRSQRDTAPSGQPPIWQDAPVLRTDQSFTVSVWVRPTDLVMHTATAVAQKAGQVSAFYLSARLLTVNGNLQHSWGFTVYQADQDGSGVTAAQRTKALDADDMSTWTHLVGVYDAGAKEIRLYVNGSLAESQPITQAIHATGPMTVGTGWFTPTGGTGYWADLWPGEIDDLATYQGAMTDAAVKLLFVDESAELD